MSMLQKAITIIEENLLQDFTLDSISNEVHYSKYHLSREFNTRVGMSIPTYIKLRRLTVAVLLMNEDKYQISDIAFKCGFNSVSYFIKVFKDIHGITPNEYKKGNVYIQLLSKIKIGGIKMFDKIEDINNYIFKEYNNYNSVNQLFANFENIVLHESNDTSVDYFALLEDKKGHCLWECNLNVLTGISEKAIIAHDKNNEKITMNKLIKEDNDIIVECYNDKNNKTYQGKLVDIGKAEYIVDMCRIVDSYIDQMEHYIQEQPTEDMVNVMLKEIEGLFKIKNNLEIKDYIKTKHHFELVRLVNSKALLVYLINNNETFTVFDILVNLQTKNYSYNYNSAFNNFDKKGTLVWNSNTLEIRLDNEYFAELRLGTGELYKLYNSSYAIEFKHNLRGLSSISFETIS